MSSKFLIYKYTSPSGKSYIGQTNNLTRRSNKHRTSESCRAFAAAISCYGWDAFKLQILASDLTQDDANKLEQYFIASHSTLSPFGYNLRTGGGNGLLSEETLVMLRKIQSNKSEEWRRKIAETLRGRPLAPGVAEKISAANKGSKRSEETKAKMAEARRAYWERKRAEADAAGVRLSSPLKGVPKSEETKRKLAASQIKFQAQKRMAAKKAAIG